MHLWKQEPSDGRWVRVPIPEEGLAMCRSPDGAVSLGARDSPRPIALLVPFVENEMEHAALVRSPLAQSLWLNGHQPVGDLRVLRDRDEIVLNGEVLYFGTASDVEVVPFPDIDAQALCARCTGVLHSRDRAVACPSCRAWHHEGKLARASEESRSCWSYDDRCACCGRSRESLAWRPEDEHD